MIRLAIVLALCAAPLVAATDELPALLKDIQQREKNGSPSDPALAAALVQVGALYEKRGHSADAEAAYRRALPILDPPLGVKGAELGLVLHRLALLCEGQGRFDEAEQLHGRALAVRKERLGAMHPDVAQSLNGLAAVNYYQGKYAEAEPLAVQALGVREKALGRRHEDVATSLNNLAALQASLGDYQAAKRNFLQAVAVRLALGAPKPDALPADLEAFVARRPDPQKTEPEERALLARLDQDLKRRPVSTPELSQTLVNLGETCKALGRYDDALMLQNHALAFSERSAGGQLPVARSLKKLAALHAARGDTASAERALKRALALREQVHGKDHPKVVQYLRALGELYLSLGRAKDAAPLYERADAIQRRLEARAPQADERPISENLPFSFDKIARPR